MENTFRVEEKENNDLLGKAMIYARQSFPPI
jgi:hypothetical protein